MPDTQPELLENLSRIHEQIDTACNKVGRHPASVRLMLVTKTVSLERILACAELEAKQFRATLPILLGENKAQEATEKTLKLREVQAPLTPLSWHFIGHCQRNKVASVLKFADCVQSVDRFPLAEKLQQQLETEFPRRILPVFIQVNTSEEASKFGTSLKEAEDLITSVAALPQLRVNGLMTLGLNSADEKAVRTCFSQLRYLQERIQSQHIESAPVTELSMGMSGDYPWAIAEGATIIRLGTQLFGPRSL
ncbi:MAG: YggS family pyridoxal phosphate-dependent enzyme [Cyanobacteria bacterium]|nr:YggS family pyridoxal phosphate-dependent enzyme [Cyanobacteriota bacterium]